MKWCVSVDRNHDRLDSQHPQPYDQGSQLQAALHRRATVIYDSTMITPELMAESLDSAGYPVGADAIGHTSLADTSSSWSGNSSRVTVTNPVDLAMSGDYRKY